MLNFRRIELSDKKAVDNALRESNIRASFYSFGTLYTWAELINIEIAFFDTLVLIRFTVKSGRLYCFPLGKGDIKAAVEAMLEESVADSVRFRLVQILEEHKAVLEQLFPEKFYYTYNRGASEYVYLTENMANLPGKKFHGKKGHVNAFFRNHTDISCDPVTKDNVHICLEIAEKWLDAKQDDDGSLDVENAALRSSVKNFSELGFMGALLYADGKPVAFTLGEYTGNDVFCTHYEKTLPDYKDAYPVINNGFTKLMLASYKYVNREEDTGSPGLRKAKLSYHPEFLVNKYTAVLCDDYTRKYAVTENDYDELVALWTTVFGDNCETVRYFLDHAVKNDDIFAFRKEGKIVSAFYLIDSVIVKGREKHNSKYLYAAATLPAYRNNGFMGKMIEYASKIYAEKGYEYIFLYPATDSLTAYYNKFGFITAFENNEYRIAAEELYNYKGKRYFNSSLSYSRLRECIPSDAFTLFSDGYMDYVMNVYSRYGMKISAVFDDEDEVVLVGNGNDGTIIIDEAISSDGNYEHILSVISDIPAKEYILKTPSCIELKTGTKTVNQAGMILPLKNNTIDDKKIYIGQPCM